jgi:hypothetical protein
VKTVGVRTHHVVGVWAERSEVGQQGATTKILMELFLHLSNGQKKEGE